jgi:hypothetical protein
MADIFGKREQVYGGGFTSDTGIIEAGTKLSGLMMQSLQITYQRPVTKVYDLGVYLTDSRVYYVEGRPSGSMQIGRIVGFGYQMGEFYREYGNACLASDKTLRIKLGSSVCPPAGFDFALKGVKTVSMSACVLTSVGLSVQAQQLIVNENSAMEFANMSIEEAPAKK